MKTAIQFFQFENREKLLNDRVIERLSVLKCLASTAADKLLTNLPSVMFLECNVGDVLHRD